MNFTEWKVFGELETEPCKISWPARHQMCFAVASGVGFSVKTVLNLDSLDEKGDLFLADL